MLPEFARFSSKNIDLSGQTHCSGIHQQDISLNVELDVEKSEREKAQGVSSAPLSVQSMWASMPTHAEV